MGFKCYGPIEVDMVSDQTAKDPYKALHRMAKRDDLDVREEMRSSLYSNLSWNRLQQIVADLDIELPIRNRSTACDALADYGAFLGPVGDNTVYIHKDGVTKSLNQHLAEQNDEDDIPWE